MEAYGYQRIKEIGKGAFGKAILCESTRDGKRYVAKEINFSNMSKPERDSCLNEIKVLRKVNHPNIVKYVDHFNTRNTLYIVMEYADSGDLGALIKRYKARGGLPESQIMHYFVQICLAMKHLHENNILHRDIKAQNVFLSHNRKLVKMGDFGISTVLRNTGALAKTQCGTPFYFSPELCKGRPYNAKSDVWSLGCLLYEMCTGSPPFAGQNMRGLMQAICNGNFRPLPTSFSKDLRSLVSSMLQRTPDNRPTMLQIIKIPHIQSRIKQIITDQRKGEAPVVNPNPAPAPKPTEQKEQQRDRKVERAPPGPHVAPPPPAPAAAAAPLPNPMPNPNNNNANHNNNNPEPFIRRPSAADPKPAAAGAGVDNNRWGGAKGAQQSAPQHPGGIDLDARLEQLRENIRKMEKIRLANQNLKENREREREQQAAKDRERREKEAAQREKEREKERERERQYAEHRMNFRERERERERNVVRGRGGYQMKPGDHVQPPAQQQPGGPAKRPAGGADLPRDMKEVRERLDRQRTNHRNNLNNRKEEATKQRPPAAAAFFGPGGEPAGVQNPNREARDPSARRPSGWDDKHRREREDWRHRRARAASVPQDPRAVPRRAPAAAAPGPAAAPSAPHPVPVPARARSGSIDSVKPAAVERNAEEQKQRREKRRVERKEEEEYAAMVTHMTLALDEADNAANNKKAAKPKEERNNDDNPPPPAPPLDDKERRAADREREREKEKERLRAKAATKAREEARRQEGVREAAPPEFRRRREHNDLRSKPRVERKGYGLGPRREGGEAHFHPGPQRHHEAATREA